VLGAWRLLFKLLGVIGVARRAVCRLQMAWHGAWVGLDSSLSCRFPPAPRFV
jgi:hypothetical protein